jgi:hypothetical protein
MLPCCSVEPDNALASSTMCVRVLLMQDDMKARNAQLTAMPEDDERFPLSPSRSSQVSQCCVRRTWTEAGAHVGLLDAHSS